MSAKFTPGPWKISRGAQADAYAIEGPARTVAHVKYGPDCTSDAHLIAAAPDLYEALRRAKIALAATLAGVTVGDIDDVRATASVALAKARGES